WLNFARTRRDQNHNRVLCQHIVKLLGHVLWATAIGGLERLAPAKPRPVVGTRYAHASHLLVDARHGQRLPQALHRLEDDHGPVIHHGVGVRESHAKDVVFLPSGVAGHHDAHGLVLRLEIHKVDGV
ncbi:MAG: hypothetical protein ACK55Z_17885, partial [bacterium]